MHSPREGGMAPTPLTRPPAPHPEHRAPCPHRTTHGQVSSAQAHGPMEEVRWGFSGAALRVRDVHNVTPMSRNVQCCIG